ncbi:hypothetical protein BK742_03445 [Bacillus thuringiensis serovar pingluonsis]|uniref:Uncharacterized protein n=3 Tax=Bacillus cereus group TaxID=86661 RepID=A0A243CXW6_BACTU|nr:MULTISPECIES: hypothetical protein [Bacillus cereus group]EEM86177.1 hypothetical protein bthur0012_58210 [Bacillus thuringiensis serovar pulsiensis BGSC 4CC1]MEB9685873.1 hypothetical protein [Bacillus anthracis]OTY48991.1 hypothetical protein BK742_03445 [Bacillus thuringiensis serovar pingluonsis]OTY76721.1 hypothetical protein BK749_11405 [Bacillus thuringiensis serovar vazensis]UYW71961.1 hypothetical protein OK229_28375 [Bacillus cereus]
MNLIIEVKDVVGTLISTADVSIVSSGGRISGKTDRLGKVILGPMPVERFKIEVTHPLYLEEEVNVTPPPEGGGHFLWDNPVWTFTPPSTVMVQMSRIRAAPFFPISNNEMKQRDSFNPKGVFTWIDHAGNHTGRYLGMFNDESLFVPVKHPLLPTKPSEEWGRLNHGEPEKINPSRTGDLFWLEWGIGDKSPRLLVAVWVPRWRGVTQSKLDFVTFFTPNTAIPEKFPARKEDYPYLAWKTGDILVQPYPGLGHRYLFREKWLSYQLLAAKRQAVLVIPIQPYGKWGPFAHAAGLARLLAEITHFLHRTGHTSGYQTSTDEDHALTPSFRFNRNAIHQPPPPIQRVVLSGFSAGVGPIVNMLPTTIGQKMNDPDFSINGIDSHTLFGADVAPFLNAWKEVWDHDAPDYIRKNLDKDLPVWLRKDSKRMARCYQTDDTGSQGWIEKTPLLEFVTGPLLKPENGLVAAERHADNRCSLVYFGKGYLKHHVTSTLGIPPGFWGSKDDHQAVPMVTFMHAALLSGLVKF